MYEHKKCPASCRVIFDWVSGDSILTAVSLRAPFRNSWSHRATPKDAKNSALRSSPRNSLAIDSTVATPMPAYSRVFDGRGVSEFMESDVMVSSMLGRTVCEPDAGMFSLVIDPKSRRWPWSFIREYISVISFLDSVMIGCCCCCCCWPASPPPLTSASAVRSSMASNIRPNRSRDKSISSGLDRRNRIAFPNFEGSSRSASNSALPSTACSSSFTEDRTRVRNFLLGVVGTTFTCAAGIEWPAPCRDTRCCCVFVVVKSGCRTKADAIAMDPRWRSHRRAARFSFVCLGCFMTTVVGFF
mmetsp:Transcript_1124/g.2529  ORF Transcript_1124/g.2529 Transcript_1124/m.2529 type:complete len:300 (+) Transcript_1124:813-1712(+)